MTLALVSKNEIITESASALEQRNLIKDMWFKGHGTEVDLDVFWHVCKHKKLDPFSRQIYPVFRMTKQKDGSKIEQMTIQTGIDGFRLIADRTDRYCPGREASYQYDKNGNLFSATSYIKKLTKDGTWHEVPGIAHYSEFVQKNYDGTPTKFWSQMPWLMLAKCAEAIALRKAFPEDLSGIYINEEMSQADTIDVTPVPNVKQLDKPKTKEVKQDTIDQDEAFLVEAFLKQAPLEYQEKMNDWLKKKGYSVLTDMPRDIYEEVVTKLKIKIAAIKQSEIEHEDENSEAA